jgi:hypothetical protein
LRLYRSSIEKILDEQERDTIITNPKEPVRTFCRKVRFLLSVWRDKMKKLLSH